MKPLSTMVENLNTALIPKGSIPLWNHFGSKQARIKATVTVNLQSVFFADHRGLRIPERLICSRPWTGGRVHYRQFSVTGAAS